MESTKLKTLAQEGRALTTERASLVRLLAIQRREDVDLHGAFSQTLIVQLSSIPLQLRERGRDLDEGIEVGGGALGLSSMAEKGTLTLVEVATSERGGAINWDWESIFPAQLAK